MTPPTSAPRQANLPPRSPTAVTETGGQTRSDEIEANPTRTATLDEVGNAGQGTPAGASAQAIPQSERDRTRSFAPPGQLLREAPTETSEPQSAREPPPLECSETSSTCASRLEVLLADTTRRWIVEPAEAADYVSGARLIAYTRVAEDLSCREIATGLNEAETGVTALDSAIRDERALSRPTLRLEQTRAIAAEAMVRLVEARDRRC
ncbi:MAG: hypothetical protein ACFCUN_10040 [Hyphomicrobiaceae bacterium]